MNLNSFLRILFVSILVISSVNGLYSQAKTVYGQVLDEQGEPIIGAVVRPDESKYTDYAVTDINGVFSITVPEDKQTLFVSYLGYKSQTVVITEGIIRVVLKEDFYEFNDHPIPYFFPIRRDGESRKHTEGVTSASASFPYPSYRIVTNPVQTLEGVAAGLRTVTLTNSAPQSFQAIIRGIQSFSAAGPLYVIDGVPMPEDPSGMLLSHLSTADIAFMYVLRNPDETAFYGARGANGVILIYTRNADRHRGNAKVRFSARAGYTGKPETGKTEETPMLQDVFSQQYNVSYTTGTDSRKNRWSPHAHLSLDYLNAPSVLKRNDLQRYSILLNLDQQPGNLIEYGVGLNASHLQVNRRNASRVFITPYFRLRLNQYLSLTSRGSMDKTRSLAAYLPSSYPAQRSMWTVSNLFTYKNNPIYYINYKLKILVTAGQEMQRVYGTTLHSFPVHADVEHTSVGKLSVNYRLEGFHRTGQTRWGSFGSIGYRLNLHNWLYPDDDYLLLLRTSYGSLGNISPLLSGSWERTGKWNVGLDLGLTFKGYLTGLGFSADYYRHNTHDLLYNTDAAIRNQGMEFTLSMLFDHWRNSWKVDLTASRNTGRLTGYDTKHTTALLIIHPWSGYYYDPDWFGSVTQTFSLPNKFDIRLQCNYSLGDGKSFIVPQVLPGMTAENGRGSYFSIYSLNFTYHLKERNWREYFSPLAVFIEGNNLHTFGKSKLSYPDYLTAGRSIVAGIHWQF